MSAILLRPFDSLANRDITIPFRARTKTRALIFVFSGVNSTGTPITRADLGRLQIMRDGKNIDTEMTFSHIDAVRLHYSRSDFGAPQFSSTGSSNAQASFYLPLYVRGDKEQVDEFSDQSMLRLIHNDLSALLSSLQCQIYTVPALGVKKYEVNYNDFSLETDSALVRATKRLSAKNVQFLGVDYDANHTNVRISKDGKEVYDISATDLNSLASPLDMITAFETVEPGDTFAEDSAAHLPYVFRLNETGNEAALGNDTTISVVSTSATFTGFTQSLEFREETTRNSVANYAGKIARNRMRAQ